MCIRDRYRTSHLAAAIPRKKVNIVDTEAVFSEIHTGTKSSSGINLLLLLVIAVNLVEAGLIPLPAPTQIGRSVRLPYLFSLP